MFHLRQIPVFIWQFLKAIKVCVVYSMIFSSCTPDQIDEKNIRSEEIGQVINRMTDIMVHDITNPPLASRFFSYACLAGYEVISQNDRQHRSMHYLLNHYPLLKKPDTRLNWSA